MQDIYEYIDAHAEEYVGDLQTLVRQPSISAQGVGLRECAELVIQMMQRDGLDARLHELDGGPPVITGHMTTARSDAHDVVLFTLRCTATRTAGRVDTWWPMVSGDRRWRDVWSWMQR